MSNVFKVTLKLSIKVAQCTTAVVSANIHPPISPEQSSTGPERQPASADLHTTHQKTEEEGDQVAKDETDLTFTPEKALSMLTPPLLAQLRTENADSFDMEEVWGFPVFLLPSSYCFFLSFRG